MAEAAPEESQPEPEEQPQAAEAASGPEEAAGEGGGDASGENPDLKVVPEEAADGENASADDPDASAEADDAGASAEAGDPGDEPEPAPDGPVPYDFRHPSLLAPSETRRLRMRHEAFTRSLATRLSIFLRMEFVMRIENLNTTTFRNFVDRLPNPTHYTLFRLEPLDGMGFIEMSSKLGLTIVDRMMGGPGQTVDLGRDLTEIERGLLDQAMMVFLTEWSQHVSREIELEQVLMGHENNGRFIQIVANDANVLVLTMNIRLGELEETIHLCFPYEMMGALIRKLGSRPASIITEQTPSRKGLPTWNPNLGNLKIPVTALWPNLSISARKLTELKVGDVLPIDARQGSQVSLRMAKVPKFVGRLGTAGKTWAVELTGTHKP